MTLWQTILSQTQTKEQPTGTVLVLGPSFYADPLVLEHSFEPLFGEDKEDLLAKMNIFSLPLKKYAYPLLKQVTEIPQLVLIPLDWRKPWDFLSILKEALLLVETHFESLPEKKSFLEHLYRLQYMGQLSESDAHLVPLDKGVLSKSTGIPIVIACEYAEYIDHYRKEGIYPNDTLDKIQQLIRSVGLCYGCAVFNVHSNQSETLERLKKYLASLLKVRGLEWGYKADAVTKDKMAIPLGWDSMGKIRLLNKEFSMDLESFDWQTMELQYQEWVPQPEKKHHATIEEQLIEAENEEEFIARIADILGKVEDNEKPRLTTNLPTNIKDPVQNEVLANFFQSLLQKKK